METGKPWFPVETRRVHSGFIVSTSVYLNLNSNNFEYSKKRSKITAVIRALESYGSAIQPSRPLEEI